MSHGIRKAVAAAAAASAGWIGLMRPRTESPEVLEQLKQYDYAHRGYHDEEKGIPENSMAAFQRGVEAGFGMELDVHVSKDGHLVVLHDHELRRMCGVEGRVEEKTLEELEQLHLLDTEEKIPLLRQVLELVDGRVPLIIELKVMKNHEELCQKVSKLLDEYSGLYCIESFDPRAVAWYKKHRPEVVRGQLLTYLRKYGNTEYPALLDFALRNLLTNCWTQPDFIAYDVRERENLSLQLCRKLYHVCEVDWTVRSPELYRKVKADHALVIFENFDPRA